MFHAPAVARIHRTRPMHAQSPAHRRPDIQLRDAGARVGRLCCYRVLAQTVQWRHCALPEPPLFNYWTQAATAHARSAVHNPDAACIHGMHAARPQPPITCFIRRSRMSQRPLRRAARAQRTARSTRCRHVGSPSGDPSCRPTTGSGHRAPGSPPYTAVPHWRTVPSHRLGKTPPIFRHCANALLLRTQ